MGGVWFHQWWGGCPRWGIVLSTPPLFHHLLMRPLNLEILSLDIVSFSHFVKEEMEW